MYSTILYYNVKLTVQTSRALGTRPVLAPSPPPGASRETAAVYNVDNEGLLFTFYLLPARHQLELEGFKILDQETLLCRTP